METSEEEDRVGLLALVLVEPAHDLCAFVVRSFFLPDFVAGVFPIRPFGTIAGRFIERRLKNRKIKFLLLRRLLCDCIARVVSSS